MRILLLSGGSGQRLWPLSSELRPKQFIRFIRKEDGGFHSMLQNIWGHLQSAGLRESALIVTNKNQKKLVACQIGEDIPLIEEPERRDTFAAIALSAAYLNSVVKADRDETVVVLPVDSYAEDGFYQNINLLEQLLNLSGAKLGLVGIDPRNPSEKYGYIVPKSRNDPLPFVRVERFVEKPEKKIAEQLIADGALWNCGIFTFKLGYLLDILEEKGYPTNYERLREGYSSLPKRSFDHEVVESEPNIAAVPFSGDWSDLGTWQEFLVHMPETANGLGTVSDSCVGSHMINELSIPIVMVGVTNLIVVASRDGILVADKSASVGIKQFVQNFSDIPSRACGCMDHPMNENAEGV